MKIFKNWMFWAAIVVVLIVTYVFAYVWFDGDRKKAALLLAYLDLNKYGGDAAPKSEAGYNTIAKGYYDGTHGSNFYGWKAAALSGKGTKGASSSDLNKLIKENPEAWKIVKSIKPTF